MLAASVASPGARAHAQGVEARLVREIGSYDGADALGRIPDLTVDREGRIWVLQPVGSTVRVFSGTGTTLMELGGEGEGPGELLSPHRIGTVADSVWIADRGRGRLTVLGPGGDLVRTVTFIHPEEGEHLTPARPGALMDDGSVWTFAGALADAISDGRVSALPIRRRAGEGELRRVTTVRSQPSVRRVAFEDRLGALFLPHPFAWRDIWDPVPGGDGLVLLRQTPGTGLALEHLSSAGVERRSTPVELPALTVTSDDVDRWIAARAADFARLPSWVPELTAEDAREHLVVPPELPPVYEVLAEDADRVWLRRTPYDTGRPVRWAAVDGSGAVVGEISVPSGTHLHWIGGPVAVGVRTDELDVPFVQVFSIDRPR